MNEYRKPATIYTIGMLDLIRIEAVGIIDHGRKPATAQYRGGPDYPYVIYEEPSKSRRMRCERGHCERHEPATRYILILAGHGHPEPIPLGTPPPAVDANDLETTLRLHQEYRSNFRERSPRVHPELLAPWDDLIGRHISEKDVRVIADYRDISRGQIESG